MRPWSPGAFELAALIRWPHRAEGIDVVFGRRRTVSHEGQHAGQIQSEIHSLHHSGSVGFSVVHCLTVSSHIRHRVVDFQP